MCKCAYWRMFYKSKRQRAWNKYLRQSISSDPSRQSRRRSHRRLCGTQLPSLHWKSSPHAGRGSGVVVDGVVCGEAVVWAEIKLVIRLMSTFYELHRTSGAEYLRWQPPSSYPSEHCHKPSQRWESSKQISSRGHLYTGHTYRSIV